MHIIPPYHELNRIGHDLRHASVAVEFAATHKQPSLVSATHFPFIFFHELFRDITGRTKVGINIAVK